MEIRNVPDKEFKIIIIKMLTELVKRMDENNENFNKEMENVRKKNLKEKTSNQEYPRIEEEIKSIPEKQKLIQFITTKLVFKGNFRRKDSN